MRKLVSVIVTISLCISTFAYNNNFFVPAEAAKSLKNVELLNATEAKEFDFSGHYSGSRYQYNDNKSGIIKTFNYEMDLTQSGNIVEGTTTITSTSGDEFASMKLRGVIVNNTLHFEEYEVISEKRSPNMIWCFKSGELTLGRNGKNPVAFGPTNSYTTSYYFPCSGGYTVLKKENSNNNFSNDNTSEITPENNIALFPNPCSDFTNLTFTLNQSSQVNIQIVNLEGKSVSKIYSGNIQTGTHTQRIETTSLCLS